jgi:hypothetical protein
MMMTPASGLSNKSARITTSLFLNTPQAAAVKADTSAILTMDYNIEEYHWELKLIIDLQQEIQVIHTDNKDYA